MTFTKSQWVGNKWPSVDIFPYETDDFLVVVSSLCTAFSLPTPNIVDILDGYAADLIIDKFPVQIMMDNWTFSVASESSDVRDAVMNILEGISFTPKSDSAP
ncbi:hypothetical protein [Collimonas sp.]|jgi:hypothetical protein|uniref:hypothetical protein n=1 Tax=Collimonas sp. TaxID=1963772 RepID=UPI002BFE2C55|nr:hypothetical protein [Collimonas sp.]HWX02899.1 hypothetical protein [Collimonas sp.]